MKKAISIPLFFIWSLSAVETWSLGAVETINAQKIPIIANPLNLNYQFQASAGSAADPTAVAEPAEAYREAADPEIHLFKGKYYLFASHSGGYWRSDNLAEWEYIPCKSIVVIGNYAPAVLNLNDTLYYMASGSPRIFFTANPDRDEWQELQNNRLTIGETDPAFFLDDDGRVYLYWGCSDKKPIMGVEIDPRNGFAPIGEPKVLITHNSDRYGWEAQWREDDTSRDGWNEGASMFKHNGKYYLQYAAPGTELRGYADGVYIGDSPLGGFAPQESNPFCIKPGGFIGGAGHGHTFRDKFGNLWHVATMKISVRHMFERRIGLFPAYFAEDGSLHAHTVWSDYPFRVPQEKMDFAKDDLSMGWQLLYSDDEQIETSSNISEIDLGKEKTVNAIQVNFADGDNYRYTLFFDNKKIERASNKPHELIVFDKPVTTCRIHISGNYSVYDVRVFGEKIKEKTVKNFSAVMDKNDNCIYRFTWEKQKNAAGYILRWGTKPNELHNAVMIYDTEYEGRFFNRDTEYYFELTAF